VQCTLGKNSTRRTVVRKSKHTIRVDLCRWSK